MNIFKDNKIILLIGKRNTSRVYSARDFMYNKKHKPDILPAEYTNSFNRLVIDNTVAP